MRKRFHNAVRVPICRVAILSALLTAIPSFTLSADDVYAGGGSVAASTAAARTGAARPVGTSDTVANDTTFDWHTWNESARGGIDPDVFALALRAARCAVSSGVVSDPPTLTVIDYSKPSTDPRLWVYDLREREMRYHELVAHGRGSGANFATAFSNEPDTHRTSIGLFVTEGTYVGRNGYSLRLDGLDTGFNDRARERAIVMHGAPYVSEAFIGSQGRLGRSWGCPALRDAIARELIDTVKGGGLVFSYYPDAEWMASSRFLQGCN